MLFVICLCLSVYLMNLEYKEYGKLVPGSAVTNKTSTLKVFLLIVQRVATVGVISYLYSFFDQFNNIFLDLVDFILLIVMLYFGIKAIFLLTLFLFWLLYKIGKPFLDDDHKPYE
ncbi:hypothetical protein [Enterococcus durans]|uniref:hypothetical protein n=1 Tax=Enterococcus durans TaxID=53345 RepID=UPI0039A41A2D